MYVYTAIHIAPKHVTMSVCCTDDACSILHFTASSNVARCCLTDLAVLTLTAVMTYASRPCPFVLFVTSKRTPALLKR